MNRFDIVDHMDFFRHTHIDGAVRFGLRLTAQKFWFATKILLKGF